MHDQMCELVILLLLSRAFATILTVLCNIVQAPTDGQVSQETALAQQITKGQAQP